jgi:hypothetical protein
MPDGTVPWHKDFNADQDLVLCKGWIDHMKALPLTAPKKPLYDLEGKRKRQ